MGLFSGAKSAAPPPPIGVGSAQSADPFGAGGYAGWLVGHAAGATAAPQPQAQGTSSASAGQQIQAQANPLLTALASAAGNKSKSLLGQ